MTAHVCGSCGACAASASATRRCVVKPPIPPHRETAVRELEALVAEVARGIARDVDGSDDCSKAYHVLAARLCRAAEPLVAAWGAALAAETRERGAGPEVRRG